MEQYRKVIKSKESEQIKPNEIRITNVGRKRNYISYAVSLLSGEPENQETKTEDKIVKQDKVVLKAMRLVINKAVSVAEIVKRRVKGVHQITEISSTPVYDEWEPLEEGLEKVTTKRTVSSITITLSTQPLDKNHPGYQAPLPESEVQPFQPQKKKIEKKENKKDEENEKNNNENEEEENENNNDEEKNENNKKPRNSGRGRYRGRGRGRGRGRRGRGRGRRGRGRGRFRGRFRGGKKNNNDSSNENNTVQTSTPQETPQN